MVELSFQYRVQTDHLIVRSIIHRNFCDFVHTPTASNPLFNCTQMDPNDAIIKSMCQKCFGVVRGDRPTAGQYERYVAYGVW